MSTEAVDCHVPSEGAHHLVSPDAVHPGVHGEEVPDLGSLARHCAEEALREAGLLEALHHVKASHGPLHGNETAMKYRPSKRCDTRFSYRTIHSGQLH